MASGHGLQGYRRFLPVHRGYEAPTLAFALELPATGFKFGIQLGQQLPKFVERALKIVLRNEKLLIDVGLFNGIAGLAGEDDQLAHHVDAAEVDAWVGLAVAHYLGTSHGFREGHLGTDFVENEVERAAQHGLDAQNLVARVAQVVDGADDGEAGAHIGFVAEFHAALQRRLLECGIRVEWSAGRNLVGCDDADVVVEKLLIERGNVLAGGAIHKHAVEHVHLGDGAAQCLGRAGLGRLQCLLIMGKVEPLAVEDGALRTGDAHHI